MRFRVLGLATIKDLPTAQFNALIAELVSAGWRKTSEYKGFDAWIDYGQIKMRRDGIRLTFEWDNWTEGSVEGSRNVVEQIAREHNLPVTYEWRWAECDEPSAKRR
ncbi:MAG: hypothetical protein LBI31_03800, partial [Zoogloeaceae bacterium]|nr:hypothetical protein [Zoogloeaceae bacterium]